MEEGIDFSFDDIDDVKNQSFPKKHLKSIYSYENSLIDNKIEYWNMHTFNDKIIEKEKISILTINDNYKANYIIKHFANKNKEYIYNNLPFLFKYLNNLRKK